MEQTITIAGKSFVVSSPYTEGDLGRPLTAGEAHTLNQTRHENIRNNFAKKVKEAKEGEDLQALITAYDQSYEFGVRGEGGGVSRDPVEVEARGLARAAIKAAMAAKGVTADAKAINGAIDTLLASPKGDKFRAVAAQRVEEKQRIAASASAEMSDVLSAISG